MIIRFRIGRFNNSVKSNCRTYETEFFDSYRENWFLEDSLNFFIQSLPALVELCGWKFVTNTVIAVNAAKKKFHRI